MTRLNGLSFTLGSTVTYAGTHLCGRETEVTDDGIYELRMLRCEACDVLFRATSVRFYFGVVGLKKNLVREQSIEDYDRECNEN